MPSAGRSGATVASKSEAGGVERARREHRRAPRERRAVPRGAASLGLGSRGAPGTATNRLIVRACWGPCACRRRPRPRPRAAPGNRLEQRRAEQRPRRPTNTYSDTRPVDDGAVAAARARARVGGSSAAKATKYTSTMRRSWVAHGARARAPGGAASATSGTRPRRETQKMKSTPTLRQRSAMATSAAPGCRSGARAYTTAASSAPRVRARVAERGQSRERAARAAAPSARASGARRRARPAP